MNLVELVIEIKPLYSYIFNFILILFCLIICYFLNYLSLLICGSTVGLILTLLVSTTFVVDDMRLFIPLNCGGIILGSNLQHFTSSFAFKIITSSITASYCLVSAIDFITFQGFFLLNARVEEHYIITLMVLSCLLFSLLVALFQYKTM